nr:MAG TPA_asm: hypothetical protein [Caudoviricetes sp.]
MTTSLIECCVCGDTPVSDAAGMHATCRCTLPVIIV